jgi:hypothetical protein
MRPVAPAIATSVSAVGGLDSPAAPASSVRVWLSYSSDMAETHPANDETHVCRLCPLCGSHDVRTRVITLLVADCLCRACGHEWMVDLDMMD